MMWSLLGPRTVRVLWIFVGVFFGVPCITAAQGQGGQEGAKLLRTPPALRAEHKRLHEELEKAIRSGGKTAQAAKEVQRRMAPHFEEEEKYAMPPIGLLQPLARGELRPDMNEAIPMAGRLEANWAKMLQEHERIIEALERLSSAAKSENKPEHARFAERLILHAKNEEQVLYPAAILIGKYLEMKLGEEGKSPPPSK